MKVNNKGTCFVSVVKCIDCHKTIYEYEKEYYLSLCEECWRHKSKSKNIIIKQLLPYQAKKYKNKDQDEEEDEEDEEEDEEDEEEDEEDEEDGEDEEDESLQNTGRGITYHKRCSKCNDSIDSNNYIKHRTLCKKCHNHNRSKNR